jgi:hypothetical protein
MSKQKPVPGIIVLDILGVELPYVAEPYIKLTFINQKVLRGITHPLPMIIARTGTEPSVRGSVR